MNYLAHIFLSGGDPKMQIGNFIGDAVKGNSYKEYPKAISDGILLHRAIDVYTDRHPAIIESVRMLKPDFGRYSAVLLDMYSDHLLASRFGEFSEIPLKRFARKFYLSAILNYRYLPERFRRFIWHFIATDRLCRYANMDGLRESLEIMVKYNRIDIQVEKAVDFFSESPEKFDFFPSFMQELRTMCNGYIDSADRAEYLKNAN